MWSTSNCAKLLRETQCLRCSKHCLIPTEYTKPLTEEKFDTLSIPYFLVKKVSRHDARYGKTDALREYDQARHCCRKALKLKFCLLLEGFQQQDTYRESQHAVVWTEDTSRRLDQIGKEDKSYIATWSERQRFENNWKLSLNAQGSIAPMTERRLLRSFQGNQRYAPER